MTGAAFLDALIVWGAFLLGVAIYVVFVKTPHVLHAEQEKLIAELREENRALKRALGLKS